MWRVIAGSVRGGSHRKLDLPNQDRCAVRRVDDWLLIAVADGAGSAARAEAGAEAATSTAADFLAASIRTAPDLSQAVREAASEARAAVATLATAEQRPLRDYACTLLLAVVGPERGAAAQIGDGVIAVRADADGWSWVFWPQKGEFANVTRFLSDADCDLQLECADLGATIQDIAVLTDGLEPLALHYASQTAHDPFFEGFAGRLRASSALGEDEELSRQLVEFLGSPRIAERVDDDLTLVMASRL